MATATRRTGLSELPVRDFSGGWNIRDAPTEIGDNESPDMFNFTLDERGGANKRRGYAKVNATVFSGGLVSQTFYWETGAHWITQAGASLYRDDVNTARVTFSSTARVGFADFAGKLWAIHPVDGVYSSTDGVSYGHISGSPAGHALLVSKNRLIALSNSSVTLSASAAGDGTDWATSVGHGWTNDIREVNDAPLIAMAGIGGEDVLGRPGFMLFKGGSFYRVYDSDTGAYTTMDANVGCASSIAAVGTPGRVCWISRSGIYWTDGTLANAREASANIRPLFDASMIAFDQADLFAAGAVGDRARFSLPRAGSTHNDLSLEYHPVQGWIVPGDDAVSCYTTYRNNTEQLYAGSPTVSGQVFQLNTGGSDNGSAITCRYQTKWFAPAGGIESWVRRVRVTGRGIFDLYTKLDFDVDDGERNPLLLTGGAAVWDVSSWDEADWAPANFEDSADLYSLGRCQYISFVARESSTIVSSAPKILGTGTAPEVGAIGLYGLIIQSVPIGV